MDVLEKEPESLIVNTTAYIFSKELFQNQNAVRHRHTLPRPQSTSLPVRQASSISLLHLTSGVKPGGRSTYPVLPIGIRARGCTPVILSFIFKSLGHQKSPEAAQ